MTAIESTPRNWQIKQLRDVANINCRSCDPRRDAPTKEFLYIDIDSVENGTGVITEPKKIVGSEAPSRARRIIHTGDVLLSTVRPYLKAFAIVPQKYDNQLCSTGFAVLTSEEEILPEFLLYSMFSTYFIDQCNRLMVGAQYPALNDTQVKQIKIVLPPLSEQRRISEILSAVDVAVQRSKAATQKTESLKQGMMRELLKKGIGHTEFKKERTLGSAPKEWNIVNLSQISKVRYGLGQPPEKDDNGVPMIRATDIDRGKVNMRDTLKIKRERIPNSRSPYLQPGEIIVVRSGVNTGDLALYLPEYGEAIAGYDLVISPERETIDPQFLTYHLLGDAAQTYFKKQSARAAQPHLNSEQLGALKVPVPQMSEQKKIATILSTIDRKLDLQRQRTAALEQLKQGLMNDLLTGERQVVA